MISKILLVAFWLVLVKAAPRQKRLSLAEYTPSYYYSNINGNPNAYSFGYDVQDPQTANNQFRYEQRHPNGTVTGSYGYIDPLGTPHRYRYIADAGGYRVYPDLPTPAPIPQPLLGNEHTESSITWTRPPRRPINNFKNNKVIRNDFASKLGILLGRPYL